MANTVGNLAQDTMHTPPHSLAARPAAIARVTPAIDHRRAQRVGAGRGIGASNLDLQSPPTPATAATALPGAGADPYRAGASSCRPASRAGQRAMSTTRLRHRRQATNETSSREVGFCVENQNLGDRGRTRQRAPCAQNRMPTARDLRPIDSACHARTVPRRPPPFQRSEANPARTCWRHCGRAPQPRARSAPAAT